MTEHKDGSLLENLDTRIQTLGECVHVSPLVRRDWTCMSPGSRQLASADPDDLQRALDAGKALPRP